MKQDHLIKDAVMRIKQKPVLSCPDEEVLASFLEGKLPAREYTRVAEHILACDQCRAALAAAYGEVPRRLRVPLEAMRKVTRLIPARESRWEVVVRFAADTVEVLKNTGRRTQYFAPVYAASRSNKVVKGSLVACEESIGGIDTEVEIERIGPGMGEVKVVLQESGGIPMPPVRVTLKSHDRELASYMAPEGTATFEKLPFGSYKILVSRRGVSLGELALEMKGE